MKGTRSGWVYVKKEDTRGDERLLACLLWRD